MSTQLDQLVIFRKEETKMLKQFKSMSESIDCPDCGDSGATYGDGGVSCPNDSNH